jgi:hypothetical protein
MDKTLRQELMYEQGVHYSGTGYYKNAADAFDAFQNFKPYRKLNLTNGEDFNHFAEGYEEMFQLRNKAIQRKIKAGNRITEIFTATGALSD